MNKFYLILQRNFRGFTKKFFDDFFNDILGVDYDQASPLKLSLILGSIFVGSCLLIIPMPLVLVIYPIIFVGSLFKSIFDYCSRKFIDEAVLPSINEKINNMNDPEMGELINHLHANDYSPQSNSSSRLLKMLSTDAQQASEAERFKQKDNQALEKAAKYTRQYLVNDGPDRSIHKSMLTFDLTNASQSEIDEIKQRREQQLKDGYAVYYQNDAPDRSFYASICMYRSRQSQKVGFEQSKKWLVNYVNDEKNNGKEIFQRVIGFFKEHNQPIVEKQSQDQQYMFYSNI